MATKPSRRRKTPIPKLNPAVFLEAARMVAQGEETFACTALCLASGVSTAEADYFVEVLRPSNARVGGAWYTGIYPYDAQVTARVLGLCLCHQLSKEGFTP